MEFVSFSYVAFLAAALLVHGCVTPGGRNLVFLAASLGFCATWDVRFAAVLVVGTLVAYAIGTKLAWERPEPSRRRWMWTAVAFELVTITAFKYSDVVFPYGATALRSLGLPVATGSMAFVPIGLSFYALARLSHALDVYLRRIEPSRDLVGFAAFVSCFPLLTSGPIERARNLLPQFARERSFDIDDLHRGAWLIFVGVFKKVFVADHCGLIVADLLGGTREPTVAGTLIGIYAFAFELYADFAGYTDIARGSARLFGLRIMENFDAPYASANLSEFWRRWHISLSTFLDEYVFKPTSLGLRHYGLAGIVGALVVTFLVSGLWHGRGATFVVWGLLHGLGVAFLAVTSRTRARLAKRVSSRALRVLAIVITFHYVCLGWVFFRAPDVHSALDLLSTLTHARFGAVSASDDFVRLLRYGGAIVLLDAFMRHARSSEWIFDRPAWARTLCYATLLLCVVRYYAPAVPFVYVQF